MHRGRVLVCRAAPSEDLRRVSTADIEANIPKKEEQEEIVDKIQVCAK